MAEYIERKEAIKMMRGSAIAKYPLSFSIGIMAAADELQKMPAADVAPVVHGRWILVDTEKWIGVCSNCNRQDRIDHLAKHCRFCGARMDLEEPNEAKESRQP